MTVMAKSGHLRLSFSLIATGLVVMFVIAYLHVDTMVNVIRYRLAIANVTTPVDASAEDYSICQIPQLDPFDPDIMSRIHLRKDQFTCSNVQPELFDLRLGKLKLLTNSTTGLSCRYRCMLYDERYANVSYGEWSVIVMNGSQEVYCETIYVLCQKTKTGKSAYENFLYQVVPKVTLRGPETDTTNDHGRPNVVMLFIDSVSRSHFIRSLPKTRDYLLEELNAIEFTGMVTVGTNTYPNTIPIFAGLSVTEKPNSEFIGPYDRWPLIWFNFSRKGYATQCTDDMPKFFAFNAYGATGFMRRPFDHFNRAQFLQISDIRHFTALDWTHCFGNIPKHELVVDALVKMFEAYPTIPKFSYAHIGVLNHDTNDDLSATDQYFLKFLKNFEKYLENTFFFFLSDHGARIGVVRETPTGETESKLPFFILKVPDWFSAAYPKLMQVLRTNGEGRILSGFDVHETLDFILQESWRTKKPLAHRRASSAAGHSFFDVIPLSRTCKDARIPPEFCVCRQAVRIPANSSIAMSGASIILVHVNGFIEQRRELCHNLTLKRVISVFAESKSASALTTASPSPLATSQQPSQLVIRLQVNPSDAVLQARVAYTPANSTFSLIGRVDRIDRYGNQSICVAEDRYLVRFCLCL